MTDDDSEKKAPATADGPPASVRSRLGRTFWTLNTIEMWERLAFYNLRVMVPIYIMQADNPGGLHLTAAGQGHHLRLVGDLSVAPARSSPAGYADRFGYKSTLAFAIGHDDRLSDDRLDGVPFISNYWGFFLAILSLATGTAFFKPSIQGSLAHNLTKDELLGRAGASSTGWSTSARSSGISSSLSPKGGPRRPATNPPRPGATCSSPPRSSPPSTSCCCSPSRTCPRGASTRPKACSGAEAHARRTSSSRACSRGMVIMSCFWLMMYQLWDLQPNFIADWVDSSRWRGPRLAARVRPHGGGAPPAARMIPQQVLLSLNAALHHPRRGRRGLADPPDAHARRAC